MVVFFPTLFGPNRPGSHLLIRRNLNLWLPKKFRDMVTLITGILCSNCYLSILISLEELTKIKSQSEIIIFVRMKEKKLCQ